MAQRSDTGDLRRAGNTQKEQQAGHFEKEVLPVYCRVETKFPYDNKRSARIALQRNGRMSLARPAAGGESCFAGFFFIFSLIFCEFFLPCIDFGNICG